MDRDRILQRLRDEQPRFRARGVRSASLFGSLARGEARSDSDVDILIELEPDSRFSLLDQAKLELELEDLLACRTDLFVSDPRNAAFRSRIAEDLVPLF